MSSQLSDTVKELIKKARIVSFAAWQPTYSADEIARFQAADDSGRYLDDADIQALQASHGEGLLPVVVALRDQVSDIVNEARAGVLATFPTITEPGGGLYPAMRADACWRDFWHFLRCITYGIAGEQRQYTSPEGLHHMQLLYRELQVPLDAMLVGLEGIKTASLNRVEPDRSQELAPYFDHLIEQMRQFRSS
jgi:hypothetical protein